MTCIRNYRRTAAFLALLAALVLGGLMPKAAAASASSAAGRVTAPGALNVRSSASTSGAILRALPSGSYVTLISRAGGWWYVEYAPSCYGYAAADYIQFVSGTYPVKVSAAVSKLNVRSGPGTSYGVVGTVASGRTALVLSGGAWDKILCNGTLVGYADAAYLKSEMLWPVPASHRLNQYYSGTHEGIDIGSSVRDVSGDSVVAAMSGKVVYAGVLNGYGYVVYIDSWYNGRPVQTRYAHLAGAPLVSAGSWVGYGQRIGYMGNTGESTGAHLHFEVRYRNSAADCISNADSAPVNPLNYVA